MKFYFFGSVIFAAILTAVSRKNLEGKIKVILFFLIDKCYLDKPADTPDDDYWN